MSLEEEFYTEQARNSKTPDMKMYDYLKQCTSQHNGEPLISYLNTSGITNEQFLAIIDETAKSLKNIGVKQGDIVSLCTVGGLETEAAKYALNKIGAVSDVVDPRTSLNGLKGILQENRSKILIMIDVAYGKIRRIVDQTNLDKILVLSPTNHLSKIESLGYYVSQIAKKREMNIPYDSGYTKWREFIDAGMAYTGEVMNTSYDRDAMAMIIHTSGTTGFPKGVMHRNLAFNAIANAYAVSGMEYERGQGILNIMPPFITYGAAITHATLCLGLHNRIIPQFDPAQFAAYIFKYRPAHLVGVPTHFEQVIDSKLLQNMDLSFIKTVAVGGDFITPTLEKKINDFLSFHNSSARVIKGYGLTEFCSSASTTYNNGDSRYNKISSVGIPLVNTEIILCKPGTHEKITEAGEVGEPCITGDSLMLGYFGDSPEIKAENKAVLQQHEDGKTYLHSKDRAYRDEDGCLFIVGRDKDMIVRPDGHNVFPQTMVKEILKHEAVADCAVVGMPSPDHTQGEFPRAFVTLKPGTQKKWSVIEKEIHDICLLSLSERDVPYEYVNVDFLPHTVGDKIDSAALKEGKFAEANSTLGTYVKKLLKK